MVPIDGIEPPLTVYKTAVISIILNRHLVVPGGIEPPTRRFSVCCYYQLSYRTIGAPTGTRTRVPRLKVWYSTAELWARMEVEVRVELTNTEVAAPPLSRLGTQPTKKTPILFLRISVFFGRKLVV